MTFVKFATNTVWLYLNSFFWWGLDTELVSTTSNCLQERKSYVKFRNEKSNCRRVKQGVPQDLSLMKRSSSYTLANPLDESNCYNNCRICSWHSTNFTLSVYQVTTAERISSCSRKCFLVYIGETIKRHSQQDL